MLAFLEHFPGKLLLTKKIAFLEKMINLSQNSRAYSIPYSCRMIFFCFITIIKLFTLLWYHLHVSLGLQLIKKEDRGFKCKKKKHYNRAFYWGKQKHNVKKPCWDQFIPISTYTKLIVPLWEAKVQEGRIGLNDMVSKDSKFEKLICERLPFATRLLSFTNSDQLKIKEQSE